LKPCIRVPENKNPTSFSQLLQVVPNIKNKLAKGLEETKKKGGGGRKTEGKRKEKKG
jgi:hypothetical protein